jgi:hypothetical protein
MSPKSLGTQRGTEAAAPPSPALLSSTMTPQHAGTQPSPMGASTVVVSPATVGGTPPPLVPPLVLPGSPATSAADTAAPDAVDLSGVGNVEELPPQTTPEGPPSALADVRRRFQDLSVDNSSGDDDDGSN